MRHAAALLVFASLAALGALGIVPAGAEALTLLLAPVVLVPLGFTAMTAPRAGGAARFLLAFHPLAAAGATASFLLPHGLLAGGLLSPWLAFSLIAALWAAARVARRGPGFSEENCLDAALLLLPVGAVWMLAWRLGAGREALVAALHLHYAGFAVGIFAGLSGRQAAAASVSPPRIFSVSAAGALVMVPLLVVRAGLPPAVEAAAVAVQAVSLVVLAVFAVLAVVPAAAGRTVQLLLSASAALLLASVMFAGAYAMGETTGRGFLPPEQMFWIHGAGASAGFALCGLLAWNLARPASHVPPPAAAPAFAPGAETPGLLPSSASLDSSLFAAAALPQALRALFETTARFGVLVKPSARRGPFPPSLDLDKPLRASFAAGPGGHSWTITTGAGGSEVCRGASAVHSHAGRSYLSSSFGKTSVVMLAATLPGGGILLTTRGRGAQGVYFRTGRFTLRLPLDQRLEILPPEDEAARSFLARHEFFAWGAGYLTAAYEIFRVG